MLKLNKFQVNEGKISFSSWAILLCDCLALDTVHKSPVHRVRDIPVGIIILLFLFLIFCHALKLKRLIYVLVVVAVVSTLITRQKSCHISSFPQRNVNNSWSENQNPQSNCGPIFPLNISSLNNSKGDAWVLLFQIC